MVLLLLLTAAHARDAALLCAVQDPIEADQTRGQVLQKGWFETMRPIDPGLATPTIDVLVAYDAVLVYPHADFLDPVGLGDVLAAYLEAGGGVVLGYGAFSDDQGLAGAFVPYLPLLPGPREQGGSGLVPVIPDHPVLVGTTWFDAGDGHRTATAGLAPGAVLVATWDDGLPLVATRETPGIGRVVALNLMPTPDTVRPGYWNRDCDVDDLLARALLWTTGYVWPFSDVCWAGTVLARDRNCNGVEAVDELPVDLGDPRCAETIDPVTGAPYPNRDEYLDYELHGCRYPVTALDPDQDGFGEGGIDVWGEDGLVDYSVLLSCDNCPYEWNPLQEDFDCDAWGDVCDTCVDVIGPPDNGDELVPWGADPWGDVCDPCPDDYNLDPPLDADGDTVFDCVDNCVDIPNFDQLNQDFDLVGDVCDLCPTVSDLYGLDKDGDGIGDGCDNCDSVPNPDQANADGDLNGDVCDICPLFAWEDDGNRDGDMRADDCDLCPDAFSSNPDDDRDGDGVGDVCDLCPGEADPTNADTDVDGLGDVCDFCPALPGGDRDDDGDGYGNDCDRCPALSDDQRDSDGDRDGDACDPCPFLVTGRDLPDADADGVPDACDGCPDEPGPVCSASGLGLRGGGRTCATGPGSFWLALLILGGMRCSSRR